MPESVRGKNPFVREQEERFPNIVDTEVV
jgi:hypothetical protein